MTRQYTITDEERDRRRERMRNAARAMHQRLGHFVLPPDMSTTQRRLYARLVGAGLDKPAALAEALRP